MMRKSLLRQQADRYLKEDHRGSHRDKTYRRFVIHNTINTFFVVGDVPPKWYALQQSHMKKLIAYWKDKGISHATIMKYMTVLRQFLTAIGHYPIEIDNKSLGLYREQSSKKSIAIPHEITSKITNTIAKLLMHLQIDFGLTLSESMRLIPDIHIQQNTLWITREMAFNSHDRSIPIRHENQARILQALITMIGTEENMISSLGYDAVRHAYRKSLLSVKLSPKKSYRYLYAKTMHATLSSTLPNHALTSLIMREMGLQSRVTLWGYLRE